MGDDEDNTQNISDGSDEETTPALLNKTYTPTKEILSKSPIRSLLRFDDSDSCDDIKVEPEVRNTSAFLTGYKEGMAAASGTDDIMGSSTNDGASLLERLNQLPNLSEALKKNGLDVSDYTVPSDPTGRAGIPSEQLADSVNTDDLLEESVLGIGNCVAQSTPYPMRSEHCVGSPVATQTDQEIAERRFHPKTPEQKLDESIKSRLLYLLEQSGNKKKKANRHVRFDMPDSPFEDNPKDLLAKQRFEYELEKKILEEELKEKVDQLLLEKKKLRELSAKKTTPRQPGKKPVKKTPQSKNKPLVSKAVPASPDTHHTSSTVQDFLLPKMLEDFPYLHVSPQVARVLWNKQVKQISALTKEDGSKTKLIKKHLEEEERRQELLLNLMKKELEFVNRVSHEKAIRDEKRLLKAKLRGKFPNLDFFTFSFK